MMTHRKFIVFGAIFAALAVPTRSRAQFFGKDPSAAYTRTNPAFLKAFKEAVAKPRESTVRVQCNGKDTSLGMVVGPDGWILTKAHDLKGDITVKLHDGKVYEARWVGAHAQHDVALLKIEATRLKPIEFTESKQVGVGNWLACVGQGEAPVAVGVVSVATRAIPKGPEPSKVGYLGVTLETADGHPRVTQIVPNSPAAKVGMKDKDLVLSLNNTGLTDHEQFVKEIQKHKPGDTVMLRVRRGDIEIELNPTLGHRPLGNPLGELQDSMGSRLSTRRGGYSTILQHDSVVKPEDCGGPIVDLQGRVIGINICRAGRTESWAVPSETIQPLLFDMMAGKLPPKVETAKLTLEQQLAAARRALKKAEEEKAQADKKLADLRSALAKLEEEAKAAAAKAAEAAGAGTDTSPEKLKAPTPAKDAAVAEVDRLVGLMQERLTLMKDVASAKWQAKRTGADLQRESELLDQLASQGEEMGLDADTVRSFFRAQFEAAKEVQQAYFDRFQKDNVELKDVPDLQKELRPKLDRVSRDLLTALAQLRPHLGNAAVQQRLRDRAAAVLTGEGINDAVRTRALEPLLKR